MKGKLIRDHIPATPTTRLPDNLYLTSLKEKLVEEANEVLEAQELHEITEEIADVYEVLDTIINMFKLDRDKIKQIQDDKFLARGGFRCRKYWIYEE